MALVVSNWVNHHFHYKKGKVEGHAPRKRFRYPDRFGEGAEAYIWPIQIAWLSNIQQSICKFSLLFFLPHTDIGTVILADSSQTVWYCGLFPAPYSMPLCKQ